MVSHSPEHNQPWGLRMGGGDSEMLTGLPARRVLAVSDRSWCPAPPRSRAREGEIGNSMRNIWYKGCFCHSQEFVMGTILSLCNCSLENVLFLIKAT